MSQGEIHEVELEMKEAKKMRDVGRSLERLRTNKDFKKVFLEGYIREEAIRLVHLKADSNMQTEQSQKLIDQDINAVGSFVQFLKTTDHTAKMAESAIEACEQALESLYEEGTE